MEATEKISIQHEDIILRIKVVQNSNRKPREVVSPLTNREQLRHHWGGAVQGAHAIRGWVTAS